MENEERMQWDSPEKQKGVENGNEKGTKSKERKKRKGDGENERKGGKRRKVSNGGDR